MILVGVVLFILKIFWEMIVIFEDFFLFLRWERGIGM